MKASYTAAKRGESNPFLKTTSLNCLKIPENVGRTFTRENTVHKLLLYLALEKKDTATDATVTNLREISILHQIKFNMQQVSPLFFYKMKALHLW